MGQSTQGASGRRKLRVGFQRSNYPEQRNILGAQTGAEYVSVFDHNRWLGKVHRLAARVSGARSQGQDRTFVFRGPRQPNVDLIHLFNSISCGPTPWLTTFETVVPRFPSLLSRHHGVAPSYRDCANDRNVQRAVEALAQPNCRGLLALSRCAETMQRELLREFGDLGEAVAEKLTVLPPPQPLLCRERKRIVRSGQPIRFILIGDAFFRKGGREVMHVLERFRREGHSLELTIVSRILPDDYVGVIEPEELASTRQRIEESRDWVTHHEGLPHDEVLRLARSADIGLLPTYADTYGYSVLELQSSGCPVITSDVRALPEINDESCGWVFSVPKNRLGEALYQTEADRSALSRSVEKGLEQAISEILARPECIEGKAVASVERIRRHHDPSRHGQQLREHYLATPS